MHNIQPVILVIDDDFAVRNSIQVYLEDYDYKVLRAEDGQVGLQQYFDEHVDLILVDIRMPHMDGLELLSEVRKHDSDLPVIVISGAGDLHDVVSALRLGATDYLIKPVMDMKILLHAIERGLERGKLLRETKNHQDVLEAQVASKTEELRGLNERLRAVVESTKRMLGIGELRQSGPLILEEFRTHLDAGGGSLYEVAESHLVWIDSVDKGHAAPSLKLPLTKGTALAAALAAPGPFIIENIHLDNCSVSGWDGYTSPTCIFFPLRDRANTVFAIIALHNPQNNTFLPQDREIGTILASYVSEALQAAKAVEAMKQSEELMLQSQKLEAVGTLASGVAHDFNNILSAIVGYTDLSLYTKECPVPLKKNLEQVKKASDRARDLVHQILSFSREEEHRVLPIDIAPIVEDTVQLIRATVPSSVKIQKNIPEDLGLIKADPGKVHQIVMNLCTNAAHAMQGADGCLTIELSKEDVGFEDAGLKQLAGKCCLKLKIQDTGHGISSEQLIRIFDPYFTTKEKSEGTGLGLAVVKNIVLNAGGAVTVESEIGEGSTFYIYFPWVAEQKERSEPSQNSTIQPGSERILFVDDEETLAEMAEKMLKKLGYEVTIMTDSLSAKETIENESGNYDLVITDQSMPVLSGMELAREILAICPTMPVILYTGYSAAVNEAEAKEIGIRQVLLKPLSMTLLSQSIRNVLDNPAT